MTRIIFFLLLTFTASAHAQPNVSLQSQNQEYLPGDTLNISFEVSGFTDIIAYQLAIQFELGKLEFLWVDSTSSDLGLTYDNFGYAKLYQGLLPTNMSTIDPVSIPDGSTLFSLVFMAKDTGSLHQDLWLQHTAVMSSLGNPFLVKPLAYNQALESGPISLAWYDVATSTTSPVSATNVQAIPNPCPLYTTIAFDAIGVTEFTCHVTDMSGRHIKTITGVTSPGTNELPITLPAPGMYLVAINTKCATFVEKVVAH